jgi:hypothetical protein
MFIQINILEILGKNLVFDNIKINKMHKIKHLIS